MREYPAVPASSGTSGALAGAARGGLLTPAKPAVAERIAPPASDPSLSALEGVADGVLLLRPGDDGTLRIEHATQRAAAALGETPARLAGRRPTQIRLHPAGADLASALEQGLVREGMTVEIAARGSAASTRQLRLGPWEGVPGGIVAVLFNLSGREFLEHVTAELPAALIVLDREFRLRWVNAAAERMCGRRLAELAGRSIYDLVPDAHSRRELHGRLLAGESAQTRAIAIGESPVRYFDVDYRPLPGAAGEVEGVLLLATDVTERIAAERSAQATELRFGAIIDASRGILKLVDRDGRISYVSQALNTLIGASPGGDLGQPAFARAHPEDRPAAELLLGRCLAGEAGSDQMPVELRMRRTNGEWRWFEVSFLNLIGHPAVGAVALYYRDVTERRDVQAALTRTERSLSVLLEGSGAALWELDVRQDIFEANDDYYRMRGLDPLTTRTGHFDPLADVHESDVAAARRQLAALLGGYAPLWDVECRVRCADGGWRWLLHRGRVAERDADGRVTRVSGICLDVDRHRRTREALAEVRERLARALEGAAVTLWDWHVARGVVQWSDGRSHRVGHRDAREESEALGRMHPQDVAAFERALLAHQRSDAGAWEIEYRLVMGDGTTRWRLDRGRVTQVSLGGDAQRASGVSLDIDARKQVEQALQRSEARYRAVAEMTSGYVCESRLNEDGSTHWIWATPGFQAIFGVTPEEMSRLDWTSLLHPDARNAALARERRLNSGEEAAGETHIMSRSGEERWLRVANRPILDPATGRVAGAIGMGIDITSQKLAEQARAATEELLRVAMAHAPEGIALLDARGHIILANGALAAIVGEGGDALRGRAIAGLAATQRLAEALAPEALASQAPVAGERIEGEFLTRTGERRAVRLSAVRLPRGEHAATYLLYVEDVTARRLLEREVLEAAGREQARVGSDLHDGLGQELTGLSLLLKGLRGDVERGLPVTRDRLGELATIVAGAIETTRSMARGLSPVGLEAGGFEAAIRSLANHAEALYGIKVRVRRQGAAAVEPPASAAHHLYRICQEALSNAARHGGAPHAVITLASTPQRITLSVRDDGVGFVPGQEPGGMGLKLMRYRAALIAADVRVESRPGAGARVLCHLDLAAPAHRAHEPPAH
jgi:PAS domain S-box-containing protein